MNASATQDFTQAAAHYKRDGYVIVRNLLPLPVVEKVFADMHRLCAQQLERFGLPQAKGDSIEAVHKDLQALFNKDVKAYLATLTLSAKLLSLYDLYMHPNVRACAAALGVTFPVFQTAPVMHLISSALKIPDGYQGYGVHQDWPTLQGGLDTLTLWVPFVDVDRTMYTMDVIPGSHVDGIAPSTRHANFFEVNPEAYAGKDFVPIEAKRGDVVFMSSFMIHRSSTVGDERLRVSTSMRYENAAEPHFIARNYPFAHKRQVIQELITPDFPSAAQVRKLYE